MGWTVPNDEQIAVEVLQLVLEILWEVGRRFSEHNNAARLRPLIVNKFSHENKKPRPVRKTGATL